MAPLRNARSRRGEGLLPLNQLAKGCLNRVSELLSGVLVSKLIFGGVRVVHHIGQIRQAEPVLLGDATRYSFLESGPCRRHSLVANAVSSYQPLISSR